MQAEVKEETEYITYFKKNISAYLLLLIIILDCIFFMVFEFSDFINVNWQHIFYSNTFSPFKHKWHKTSAIICEMNKPNHDEVTQNTINVITDYA